MRGAVSTELRVRKERRAPRIMQHEKGGLREEHGKEASQSTIKQPILLFLVKDMQTLRQRQSKVAISALEGSARWPDQLQEPIAITQQL